MQEDISKMPLNKLILEISRLEQKIELETIKYNLLRVELLNRYPQLEKEFEEKRK